MDLILTGRPVDGDEAERIGLVNRVVEPGTAREEAEQLGFDLLEFPQECMHNDRLSVLDQWGATERDAMAHELALGKLSLQAGALDGAARFVDGAGRHGVF
jgi:enoyl-CoA hydratase